MKLESFVAGKGEPLLFLGGAFTTYDYCKDFIKLLGKKYKVYFLMVCTLLNIYYNKLV